MKIVFLSHTARSSIFKVGSYYLSKQMALLGHEILYISSPLSFLHLIAYLFSGRRSDELRKRVSLLSPLKDNDGIINFIPLLLFPYINLGFFNSYKLYKYLNIDFTNSKRTARRLGFDDADLVIQDSLKLNFMKKNIRGKKWIYRATDLYKKMPNAPTTSMEAEFEAVNSSDLVFSTSYPLKQYLEKTYHTRVMVLINGVSFDNFSKGYSVPTLYNELKGIICVYVGSMDSRFDFELMEFLGKKSTINVILIGPIEKSRLDEYDNIYCLGEIKNEQLPKYLTNADVGLLPFKIIDSNHSRSPMKIYEYGAAGLPVISTKLKEIVQRNSGFVLIADNYEEFYELIHKAANEKDEIMQYARAEAKKYSWESITSNFLSKVV